MAAGELTYRGLVSGAGDGQGTRLQVATPSGLIREIPLDRRQVMRILRSAVATLEYLDDEDRRAARGEYVHEADILSDTVECGLPRRDVEWSSVTTRTTCPACIEART